MSKYIIELGEDANMVQVISVTQSGNAYIDSTVYVEHLEQLTSDYINEHYGDMQDTAYQRGLNDAWEAARKIFGYEIDGGIPIDEIGSVFGYSENATFCTADIFRHNTVSEAIEKLKAYEEKQKADEKIEVGDEVEWDNDFTGDRFIVTRIFQPRNGKEQCDGIDDDGCVYHDVLMDDLEKTGRHFDIASILEDMRND